MKDFLGKEIGEGDLVVYSSFNGSQLGKGVVIKICDVMLRVAPITTHHATKKETVATGWSKLRDPNYCVVAGSNFMGYPNPNKCEDE